MSAHVPFPTTAWTCVRAAQDPTHPTFTAAMNRLITAYWRPVFHFLRAGGNPIQQAEDLTQGFFLQFLAKGWLGRADPGRGRFRAFLKTLVKRYAIDQTARPPEQQRFESRFVSVQALMKEEDRAFEPPAGETPDEAFDRQWKAEVRATVYRNLRLHYTGAGNPDLRNRFEIFAAYHFVGPGETQPTQEELATRFGVTRETVRYALDEVGKRYERFLRQEVRDQVGAEDDVEIELRGLC